MNKLILYIAETIEQNLSIRRHLHARKIRCTHVHKIYGKTSDSNMRRAKVFAYFDHKYDGLAAEFEARGAQVLFLGEKPSVSLPTPEPMPSPQLEAVKPATAAKRVPAKKVAKGKGK